MCGIAGFTSQSQYRDGRSVLEHMTDAIHHRGPDDVGYFDAADISYEAEDVVIRRVAAGDAVLIKGSLGSKMKQIVLALDALALQGE